MDMFILLTVLQMLSLNEAYNFTCPSQAHWNLRAKSMCKPQRNYTCLFNVTFRVNVYRDRCSRPRILGPGYKYVFQPNLNRATCSATRYQPFIFDTIGNSDCTYQKSLCNSLGQETYEIGNTTVDRKCICNTDRGYSFVRNPKNQCYCNPSTEDCSCYLGINPYNETVEVKDLYRILAAILVLILSFACVVVWIIVQRAIRGWIKTRSTPRKLDIVEFTDCSITIEWFNDVPDECLSYELDHRPKGTKDWSTGTFFSEEVLEAEDGRRMYTLQNLLPETYYELKMRSVYKDAKSHYSESMTKQTLKLAPKKLDIVECTDCSITIEWFIDVSDECLSYELDHRPKGTNDWSTGTFLSEQVLEAEDGRRMYTLQNLLPETYYELKMRSVYKDAKSHYSESMTKNTVKLEIDDDKVSRIKRALIPNAEDRDTQNMQEVETNNINISQRDEMSSYKKDTTTDAMVSLDKSEDKIESSLVMPENVTTDAKFNFYKKEDTNEASSLVMPVDFSTNAKINLDNNKEKNESSSLVMPEDLMSNVFSKSTVNTPLNLYALCELWDFAGQKEFYATHQAFLTSSAVYLVVADMKDEISKQGLSQCSADFQHIGRYVFV
ncbi:unnamed protein product [Mytilus coruscus]|uniref:Fibronectin type-III domain-containing protein n=1 Tax=Mytilus coruscus TaxID=42192 RepID=A0A6J8B6E9_MYTCO|nr:unnamed protein product [Mytilus coruscus]